jgi:hypothetical protein
LRSLPLGLLLLLPLLPRARARPLLMLLLLPLLLP